ncbi:MAG: dTDP-4-dehydrorhamnose reductase [Armatimonadetes bacterium]|nr:dTDP-4-dehydrorhamnose reductase [Armatimonadota bacterium]
MRIIVTGACGMLGRLVCSALEPKHHVIPTDVLEGCERLDIIDTTQVFDTISRFRPEMVIHCAAMTDVDGCERDPDRAYLVNAVGTWNLACACASIDCTIAYVSTDYVFDGEKGAPYTEFDQPNPIGVYGASKLAGEAAVKELCRKHYIVRTSWVFAPHGKNFALTIINAAENRIRAATSPPTHLSPKEGKSIEPLRVVADQIGSPTYAKDLAEFLVSLVGSPLYGTYHYTNAGSCSWHEFASTIIETAGMTQIGVVPIKSEEWPTPTRRPKYSVLRHYRLELLGRDSARPWQDAVREFVSEWTTAKR